MGGARPEESLMVKEADDPSQFWVGGSNWKHTWLQTMNSGFESLPSRKILVKIL